MGKPYAHVYNCTAQELIGLEPRRWGLIITDPPYTAHVHRNVKTNKKRKGRPVRDIRLVFAPLRGHLHDRNIPGELGLDWLPPALERTDRWVISFCSLGQLGDYQFIAGRAYVRHGTMGRKNPMPQQSGDRPAQESEGVAIMHRPCPTAWRAEHPGEKWLRWNGRVKQDGTRGRGMPARWVRGGRVGSKGEHTHPTQKPEEVIEDMILAFAEPGDLIVDPFAGAGTTLRVAQRLGFDSVGADCGTCIKTGRPWADIANERLNQ